MRVGDVCVTLNDHGRFYKGKEVVIVECLPQMIKYGDNKYIRVRAADGFVDAWYDPNDLTLSNNN